MLRSPHAHAFISAIDTAAARGMPGELAVLTGDDARTDGLTRIPHLAAPGPPPDIVLHNRDGSAVPAAPHHVLPIDRVRHVGTAVACVIAETAVQAKDAAEHVIVSPEPLPAVTGKSPGPSSPDLWGGRAAPQFPPAKRSKSWVNGVNGPGQHINSGVDTKM
jgi:aerobic carbon-monoxide dehydrogenase large subunit